ncbi:MAG: WD40/YVTN/BNR-like repeat-containing protein, partial [Anaerolineales bacterium]
PLIPPEGMGDALFPGLLSLPSGQGVWLSDPETIWLYGEQAFSLLQGRYASLTVSRDGGKTWEELVAPMPDGVPAPGIPHFISLPTFVTNMVAYFTATYSLPTPPGEDPYGYIAFFSTQDAGYSWQTMPLVVKIDPYAVMVEYLSPQRLLLLCQKRLCLSTDGGRNWDVLESNIEAELREGTIVVDMDFVNARRGWMVLRRDDSGDLLYKTTDGGSTWEPVGR